MVFQLRLGAGLNLRIIIGVPYDEIQIAVPVLVIDRGWLSQASNE
jgi:hypothetical protein